MDVEAVAVQADKAVPARVESIFVRLRRPRVPVRASPAVVEAVAEAVAVADGLVVELAPAAPLLKAITS